MMTKTEFNDFMVDLFCEYLPKVTKTERKEFIRALWIEGMDNQLLDVEEDDYVPEEEDED